jgi:predicted dehydrogenase
MNFALLGDDPAVLPLVRAIVARSGHRLTHAAQGGETLRAVGELASGVRFHSRWEDLLLDAGIDAVIVAGSDSRTLEGARQLATAGKALILFPQAEQGSAFVYEMTLIRDDARALLFPAFPRRIHPLVRRLRELIDEGAVGPVLHLEMEREIQKPPEEGPSLLSRAEIDREFLFDVDLLRDLGGDYDRVTALRSGQGNGGTALATATLGGDGLPEAHWSLKPTASHSHWRLTVTGVDGRLTLAGEGDLSEMKLTSDGTEITADPAAAVFDAGNALLAQFEAAAKGERVRPDWTDLTRAFEMVDGAHRSVARRRTIDLHFETASERSQFKTQMTAIGCGLLVLTFFGVLALLMAGALLEIDPAVMRVARVLVFLPLFVFLVLQLLVFLARPPAEEEGKERSEDRVQAR